MEKIVRELNKFLWKRKSEKAMEEYIKEAIKIIKEMEKKEDVCI